MDTTAGIPRAAELFKVLGSETRLSLLWLLSAQPRTVGALAQAAGISQSLVSQHLRTLRQSDLVVAHRSGKAVTYRVTDTHVAHVIADALAHVNESGPVDQAGRTPPEEHPS